MAKAQKRRRRWLGRPEPGEEDGELELEPELPEVRRPRLWGWVAGAAAILLVSGAISLKLIPGLDGLFGGKAEGPEEEPKVIIAEPVWQTAATVSSFTGAAPPAGGRDEAGEASVQSPAPAAEVQQVADLYEMMPPTKAAPLLAAMEPKQAAAVLQAMQREMAAAALAEMDEAKAAQLVNLMMNPPEEGGDGA